MIRCIMIQSGMKGYVKGFTDSQQVLLHSLGTAVQREPHSTHFDTFCHELLSSIQFLYDLGCDINEQNDLGWYV
jgi:hypothetical protein